MEKATDSKNKEIDPHDPAILVALRNAQVYKKQGEVHASRAKSGEKVDTILSSGKLETTNVAKSGQIIVTNPDGEQYIMDKDEFDRKYEKKQGEDGVYLAKGYCKAINNPHKQSISLLASWGEIQVGDADCLIAVPYYPEEDKIVEEPYIIERSAFEHTYKAVER